MTVRSLVLALLCASALALTPDSASPPSKLDTKPKLQTEPQPPPRLGVVSQHGQSAPLAAPPALLLRLLRARLAALGRPAGA